MSSQDDAIFSVINDFSKEQYKSVQTTFNSILKQKVNDRLSDLNKQVTKNFNASISNGNKFNNNSSEH